MRTQPWVRAESSLRLRSCAERRPIVATDQLDLDQAYAYLEALNAVVEGGAA
jgi:hypothetical protein